MNTYVRSLCFILAKAVDDVLPAAKVYIEHAVSKGYYFRSRPMWRWVKRVRCHPRADARDRGGDLPFEQVEEETTKVVALFRSGA